MQHLTSFLTKYRMMVLVVSLLATVLFSLGALKINSEVILWDLFPYNHPFFQLHARFSQVFGGGGSTALVVIRNKDGDVFHEETLQKVKNITMEVMAWDETYRLLTKSLATHSTKVVKTKALGEISMEPLMYPDVPDTDEKMALLKKHLYSNPAYLGSIVALDGSSALLITEFKDNVSYDKTFDLLYGVVDKYSDEKADIHIVGFPMLMGWIYSHKTQMYLVFGVSILMMIGILFIMFRNFVGMTAPIVMTMICSGLGLGFIGWTGINFSPLLFVLAFLVGARIMSNAVQITCRYIEEYGSYGSSDEACVRTMRSMMMPNAVAVATDAVGFSVLALAKIVLMVHTAIMMTFWMLTIGLSGVLVPIICSILPLDENSCKLYACETNSEGLQQSNGSKLQALLAWSAGFSIKNAAFIVWPVVLFILIFGGWQTSRLHVGDETQGSPILWPDHKYNTDQFSINKRFKASSETLQLYYDGKPGSVYDPIVLTTFERFDKYMADELPDIYKSSSSIINLIKMLNMTYHDGDPLWSQLPRDPVLMEGMLGLIKQKAGNATLRQYMDAEHERAQITLFFTDHTSKNMIRIKKAAYKFFDKYPAKIPLGEFKLAGGSIGLEIALNEEMKKTHFRMDVLVLSAIFIMCTLVYRSFIAGAMLTLPLILSNLVAFSYMALNGIGLTTNTLPCAAVGVGVGVDFSIYLYSRCIEEFHRTDKNWYATIIKSVSTAGRGIFFTGMTLILPLVAWYFISPLKFQAQMGFFLAMLLFINMVGALMLHPVLIMLVKPKFISRERNKPKAIRPKRVALVNTALTGINNSSDLRQLTGRS